MPKATFCCIVISTGGIMHQNWLLALRLLLSLSSHTGLGNLPRAREALPLRRRRLCWAGIGVVERR